MSQYIWLHDDALRADHPVFAAAGANTPAFFIWDALYFQHMNYSFKRLVFIYETLCQLPCDIYQGDTGQLLQEFITQSDIKKLFVAETLNPLHQKTLTALEGLCQVAIIADEPFISLSPAVDITRFFAYWKKAEGLAMQLNGGADAS